MKRRPKIQWNGITGGMPTRLRTTGLGSWNLFLATFSTFLLFLNSMTDGSDIVKNLWNICIKVISFECRFTIYSRKVWSFWEIKIHWFYSSVQLRYRFASSAWAQTSATLWARRSLWSLATGAATPFIRRVGSTASTLWLSSSEKDGPVMIANAVSFVESLRQM